MSVNQILDNKEKPVRTIFVSSYVPRRCGLASFTKDLTSSINELNPESMAEIIAIESDDAEHYYPWEVKYKISRDDLESYYRAAEYVNQSSADVVSLQHEFGLYGGEAGEYIFNFLRNINKPIVTTLHTILDKPSAKQKEIMFRLSEISDHLVAMMPDAKERLEKNYGIDRKKIAIIHHGVAECPQTIKSSKRKFGWANNKVLLASGLIGPNKGFDFVIEAMPEILESFPETIFVIVGQTHPDIIKNVGEVYRNGLKKRAKELAVDKNVVFVNKYLPKEKLLAYYEACDIYLTPHLERGQITSGTLAYALGMGKVCISTPYTYAKGMLAQNRGLLVGFKSPTQIARAVKRVFRSPKLSLELAENAYSLGQKMRWPRVAQRYLNLFKIN